MGRNLRVLRRLVFSEVEVLEVRQACSGRTGRLQLACLYVGRRADTMVGGVAVHRRRRCTIDEHAVGAGLAQYATLTRESAADLIYLLMRRDARSPHDLAVGQAL